MADLTRRPELVVRELCMEGVDRPPGKIRLQKLDHRNERFRGSEGTGRLRMYVGPVDNGPDEGKFGSDEGNVAQRAEGSVGPARFEAERHTQVADLVFYTAETLGNQFVKVVRRPLGDVTQVGNNRVTAERLHQLHRVLDGRDGFFPSHFVLNREHCEVRRVNRHGESPLGGQFAECLTSPLIPGKSIDERELQSAVAGSDETIEPLSVVDFFGRHS